MTYAFEAGLYSAQRYIEQAKDELEDSLDESIGDEKDRLQKMIDELKSIEDRLLNFEYNAEDY